MSFPEPSEADNFFDCSKVCGHFFCGKKHHREVTANQKKELRLIRLPKF